MAHAPDPDHAGSLRSALTSRGWTLLGGGAAALIAGRLFGIAELEGLATAAIVAVLGAWVWTSRQAYQLAVHRSLHPPQPAPGRRNAVELRLRNSGPRRTPLLALQDPFDGAGPRQLLAPLGPGGTRTWRYDLPELRRGSFRVGPLLAEVNDPFGLARRRRPVGEPSRLVVHPRVLALRAPVVARASRQEGVASVSQDSGQEFADLREYVPGDDFRRIHWPSSARADTLLVREDRVERLGRVLLVLDLRRAVWTPPAFEAALEAAASVADDAIGRGLQVRLVATDGTDSQLGSGPRQRARILDQLANATMHAGGALLGPGAAVEPGPDGPATGSSGVAPGVLAGSDHTIVCTSDRSDAADFRGLVGRRRRTPLTVVLIEARGRSGPGGGRGRSGPGAPAEGPRGPAVPPGARVVRVGGGRDFPTAWNDAALR